MYRVPFLQVLGPNGGDLVKIAGSALVGVKLIDRGGGESDESFFTFTRKKPYPPTPAVGTPFTVKLGWSPTDVAVTGYYTFQRIHLLGNPKQGQSMQWICRAGDFLDHLKKVDSQHFDEETGHKTLGDLFKGLFPGQDVVVAPEIAGKSIPGGYFLQWNQSAIDAATSIAEDNGAIVKPMGNKIVVMTRGSGESGTGKPLSTVTIKFDENYDYDVELEPRFEFQSVAASWWNPEDGKLLQENKTTGFKASRDALPHPFITQDAANSAAASAAQEWQAASAQGLFTTHGEPAATSNCPVRCTGFGSPIDDTKWQATSVEHDVIPNVGWTTTIETELAE